MTKYPRFTIGALLRSLVLLLLITSCKTTPPLSSPGQTSPELGAPRTSGEMPVKILPKGPISLQPVAFDLPEIPREFRGVWIATVVNIDWPSSGMDAYEKQKKDFIRILDHYKSMNFNAVIVQVRTAGDAFYPSNLAPWSQYLTGKQGRAPKTQENPLTWMINAAHDRGLEFHAWLNPYRATFDLKTDLLSADHDYNKHRDWMLKYGPKYYYNPGLPEVKNLLTAVIEEIVVNYAVDAIHFDDYFYPYKISGQTFPDESAYRKYKSGNQSIDDWRRQNVNDLVQSVHQVIQKNKPWVQFGISPFGVWRNQDKDPKGSPTQAGQTNYDDLYADPIRWMQEGWIDYLIPQVYWSMDYNLASYRKLNDWWSNNHNNTKIYIGNGPYKIRDNADKAWDNPNEINSQVSYTRTLPNVQGNAFFSAKSLFSKNQDVAERLKSELYDKPTLPPDFIPSGQAIIARPSIATVENNESWTKITLEKPLDPAIRYALIQGADTKSGLPEAEIHTVWVGSYQARSLEVSNLETEYIAIRWIDHFGRIVNSAVYQIP